jgi:hypothetical protein
MAQKLALSSHDRMVDSLANLLKMRFEDIKANVPGFERPEKIIWKDSDKGHFPDITAHRFKNYIFEVETSDSIYDRHTADEWRLFASYAKEHNVTFCIVVPHGCSAVASRRLDELDIDAELFEL